MDIIGDFIIGFFWRGPRLLTNAAASISVDSFLYIHSSHARPRRDG